MGQIKAESGSVGCKVLPICDAVAAGSNGRESTDGCEIKDGPKIQRRRTVPRMKELLRWAAKAKAQNIGSRGWKVLHFRSRQDLKDPVDDLSSKSSKISFRWEVGSCSSTSSVYSGLSMNSSARTDQICTKNFSKLSTSLPSSECCVNALDSLKAEQHVKKAQWITTDSDFVVLEL
ncbi:uncharacterized protein [Typha latifolia]|uniref:uncharacterized protein n=1 Tax=Typha latifolia TaxID=4733 RepID=UPI003C2F5723